MHILWVLVCRRCQRSHGCKSVYGHSREHGRARAATIAWLQVSSFVTDLLVSLGRRLRVLVCFHVAPPALLGARSVLPLLHFFLFLFWKAVLKAPGEPCEWWNGAAPWCAAMGQGLAGQMGSIIAVGIPVS